MLKLSLNLRKELFYMRYFSRINRFNTLVVMILGIMMQQEAPLAVTCPCDIYAIGGTPCVAAYSTTRLLLSTYAGPLYQVRKSSDQSTKDIYPNPKSSLGIANGATQDSFLGTGAGTISKLYDQSGKGNDLIKAPGGSANSTADKESNAKGKSFTLSSHTVYALYMGTGEGYRNNKTTGVPTGNKSQGIYALEDGSRANVGCCCCFDFGNAETNNNADGTGSMNSLFFGEAYWGKGAGNGPWFMDDMEAGVWAGGSKNGDPGWGALSGTHTPNSLLPSSTWEFAFGLTKSSTNGSTGQYAIRVANGNAKGGSTPTLVTAYDGQTPSPWNMGGAILLGIGGDNSNSSTGTFYEGAFTNGRPADTTDAAILKNVLAAGYGSSTADPVEIGRQYGAHNVTQTSMFNVHYNPASAEAVISYTLQDARRVSMNIVDQQGRQIASVVSGIIPAGKHEAVWDAKRVPTGIYVCRTAIDGLERWSEKIIVSK
jgi:hypothetical protein